MANSDATKITTFVGIDGEREYKKALEEMGREMRALASEGKKLEAVRTTQTAWKHCGQKTST